MEIFFSNYFLDTAKSSLVYFPIALLIIYCICEIIWSHRLAINPSWVFMKSCLLLFGTCTYYLMLVKSGLPINPVFYEPYNINNLIFIQQLFMMVQVLFTVLSAFYLLKLVRISWPHFFNKVMQVDDLISAPFRMLVRIQRFLTDSAFVHILGVLGLSLLGLIVFVG
jgi:hypothetical protein